jgi:hypothetical protein
VGSQVSYWKFDEGYGTTAYDSVGDNDGTISGATWTNNGKFGKGLDFNNSNINTDNVFVSDILALDQSGSMTISAWSNANTQPTNNSNYKVLVIYQGASGHNLETAYTNAGYDVTVDLTATNLSAVEAYDPDIVVCDQYVWGCSYSFLNDLYNAGYNIVSQGNDTNNTILPIATSALTSVAAGTIAPDEKHPITDGWSSTGNSGTDGRQSITSINSAAFSIAKDGTNDWTEIIYLEEPDKGRWAHIQPSSSPNTTLFNNINQFILRYNIIGKGKNYNLYSYFGNLYGWVNNQKVSTSFSYTNWHNASLVYDSSNIKLFLDGIEKNSASYSSSLDTDGNDLLIGSFVDGLIDEVKIYNSALTEEEIWRDYNQGKAMVLGSSGTDSSGNPSFSADRSYCVPGDTSTCNPPVAEWKFDEMAGTTAYDTSGNGNDSTAWNGSPSWTEGRFGSALDFDGSGDSGIEVGSPSGLTGTAFTAEAWIDGTNQDAVTRIINYGDSTTNYGGFIIGQNADGTLRTFIDTTGTGSWDGLNSVGTVNDSNWHHVVLVYDGTNRYIYIDGAKDSSTDVPAGYNSTPPNPILTIGQGSYNIEEHEGKIDHVQIYDYARTPAQIAWDYNRGKPVGWWRMDEGEGTTVYDHSGNGNNGTMTNMDPATDWVDGKINTALDFDDGSDYVNIPNPDELSDEHVTVSSWVKVDVMENWHNFVANSWGADDPAGWLLYASANGPVFGLWNSTGQKNASVTMDLTDGWHHVVGVYDGSQVKTYVDGVLRSSLNASSITLETSANLTIGGSTDGFVDDVRIYNYALTPLQIKEIYNGGAVNYR